MKLPSRMVIVMALVSAITTAGFAKDIKIGDAKYEITGENTVALKDYKKATGDVVIPETISDPKDKTGKQYTVTEIRWDAFKKSPLKSIVLPETVKRIRTGVFEGCSNLSKVKLPSKIKEISASTFSECSSLEELSLGSVEILGPRFIHGTKITEITVPGTVKEIEGTAFLGSNVKKITFEAAEDTIKIGEGAFFADPIEELVIDRSLVYTGARPGPFANTVFDHHETLKSVTIGSNVKTLPADLVKGCTNLKDLNFDFSTSQMSFDDVAAALPNFDRFTIPEYDEYVDAKTYRNYLKYQNLLQDYINTAISNPIRINSVWDRLRDFPDGNNPALQPSYHAALDFVTDAVSSQKKEDVEPEIWSKRRDVLVGCLNDYMGVINLATLGWVDNKYNAIDTFKAGDVLRKSEGKLENEYNQMLQITEGLLREAENDIQKLMPTTMQIIALCGLGKWKEAAKLFPKSHAFATMRGQIPDAVADFEYIRSVINEHGYKLTKPVYPKGSKAKANSGVGQAVVDVFFDIASDAYQRHRQKKEYQKWLEEVYGKPVKKKGVRLIK